jgi:hypothetical protein
MHIVERYRLIDGAVAKAQIDKFETSEGTVGGGARVAGYNPDTSLKGLQLEVTMEDTKVFTAPLTARVTYRRVTTEWEESVCVENPTEHYEGEWIGLPRADHPRGAWGLSPLVGENAGSLIPLQGRFKGRRNNRPSNRFGGRRK